MKYTVVVLFLVFSIHLPAQVSDDLQLSFNEYIGYVKQFHPVAQQANLRIDVGQANLMKARGGFDPKLEVDYNRKDFKSQDYYDLLNATFKIPTWYGIELKANFEENSGQFLNPQNNVPDDGLYTAGVSVSLAQGLLMNERMADVKKAKFFQEQTKAERDILVNTIIYDAALAYFDWQQTYNETKMYQQFLNNAQLRFNGVKQSVLAGDKAGIDSLEANITVNKRLLSLEQAKVKLIKNRLKVSNFLWLNNNIPVEIAPNVAPVNLIDEAIDNVLKIDTLVFNINAHPKLKAIDYKLSGLTVDKRLKANMLLPKIDVQYNFITETPDVGNTFNTSNYKAGLNVAFPLFLRKERGAFKLAKLKIKSMFFERSTTKQNITNKVEGLKQELESYKIQNEIIAKMVSDYRILLIAEERKFSFGESSVFLINSREKSLIEAELKRLQLQNKFYQTKAKLFNSMAININ